MEKNSFSIIIKLSLLFHFFLQGISIAKAGMPTILDSTLHKVQSKTIIFITGAFVSPSCWDEWKIYFESKGYTTIVPDWPYKSGTPEEQRKQHPSKNSGLAKLTLTELLNHYTTIIKKCPEKPILIGHSLGGMLTQILINRDLAAAGIAIHPAPTKGILPYEFSSLKSLRKAFGFFTSKRKTYLMSFKTWKYAFTNGMTKAEQLATYEKFIIPESKTIARKGLSRQAKVNYRKPHPPLLITSGSKDHILPAHLNRRNFKKYKQSNGSITHYKKFEGRNHFVLGLPTWREDANYIFEWLTKL
jgi:pimeloyl-ACP methyl ester carboxylesterase